MAKIIFITLEKLMEMDVNGESFRIVDVLSKDMFGMGHIPGSVNIPLEEIEKGNTGDLKKEETIVVYCASYACHASTNAATKLLERGFTKVLDFKAGKQGWLDAKLELEK